MKDVRAFQHFGVRNCAVSKCTLFWGRISTHRERGMQIPLSQVVLFTATQWSSPGPSYEPCCQGMLQVLCLGELFNHKALSFALRNRQREWQREIDGETDKGKQGSASICATMCDRPVLLVLSLVDPCWIASREDRTGSAAPLPIYRRPWPGRLWNFRDSFNGIAEPQSDAETLQMAIKKQRLCTGLSAQRGHSSHAGVTRN